MEVDEYSAKRLEYNTVLKRYYAGCNYITAHPETTEKYLPQILEFKDKMDEIIITLSRAGKPMTEREILTGFEK